jgi:hypothetical protein
METKIRRYFDEIITAAKILLDNIEIEEDLSFKRALLKIAGKRGTFEVKITEIFDEEKRKYAYYMINNGIVEFGCDNAPDKKALRIKYGKDYTKHINEPIPHFHGRNKENTELSIEMDAKEFFEKIKRFNPK